MLVQVAPRRRQRTIYISSNDSGDSNSFINPLPKTSVRHPLQSTIPVNSSFKNQSINKQRNRKPPKTESTIRALNEIFPEKQYKQKHSRRGAYKPNNNYHRQKYNNGERSYVLPQSYARRSNGVYNISNDMRSAINTANGNRRTIYTNPQAPRVNRRQAQIRNSKRVVNNTTNGKIETKNIKKTLDRPIFSPKNE